MEFQKKSRNFIILVVRVCNKIAHAHKIQSRESHGNHSYIFTSYIPITLIDEVLVNGDNQINVC